MTRHPYTTPPDYALVFTAAGPSLVFVDEGLAAAVAACDAEADCDPRLGRISALLRDAAVATAKRHAELLRRRARDAVESAAAAAVEAALLDDPLVDVDVLTHRAVLLQALTYRSTFRRRHRAGDSAPTRQVESRPAETTRRSA